MGETIGGNALVLEALKEVHKQVISLDIPQEKKQRLWAAFIKYNDVLQATLKEDQQ